MLSVLTSFFGQTLNKIAAPSVLESQFMQIRGVKRVRQKRRSMGRLIQLKQSHYFPKPEEYQSVPKSVLGSGYIRRLLKAGTTTSRELVPQVAWDKFVCSTKGVRWHPCGAWRVQFSRRNHEHNFHVGVDCYFYSKIHGFGRAKELAIGYRKRVEAEWEELQRVWAELDQQAEQKKAEALKERILIESYEKELLRKDSREVSA